MFAERIGAPDLLILPLDADRAAGGGAADGVAKRLSRLCGKVALRTEATVFIQGIGGGVSLAALWRGGMLRRAGL